MIGTTLSHFRVTAKLGEGGMGEVYRAEDSKLGREVAIKVLPEAVAQDPERLARFEREAKVLASLNHPNIAAIHSIEAATSQQGTSDARLAPQEEGEAALSEHPTHPVHFLVMELAEGEDLAERLARGPVPVDDALPIAQRIAEALEAAHERGIIHRDLKPANIKVDAEGNVKVLDFGLAKALDPATGERGHDGIVSPDLQSPISMSPTLTAQMTGPGIILGTAAYMSPEQARGQEVDKRADIWAFGVVLYEMLTGRQLFDGDTVSDALAAILRADIDLDTLPEDTPVLVERLLRRCLERDRRQRLHDIADARLDLEEASRGEDLALPATATEPAPTRSRNLLWLAGSALLALLIGFGAARLGQGPPEPAGPLHVSVSLPAGTRLTGHGSPLVALSPDGTKVAYVAEGDEGQFVYVHDLGTGEIQRIEGSDDGEAPFFSPDGEWVAFGAGSLSGPSKLPGELRKASLETGIAQTLSPVPDYFGGTWAEDGTIYFAGEMDAGILRIDAAGGTPSLIAAPGSAEAKQLQRTLGLPAILPGGRSLLVTTWEGKPLGRTLLVDVETGAIKDLGLPGLIARYVPTGHLVLVGSDGTLSAVPFDLERGEVTGSPVALRQGIAIGGPLGPVLAVSNNGALLFAEGYVRNSGRELSRLVRITRQGQVENLAFEPTDFAWDLSSSPDLERLAVGTSDGWLWIYDLERGTRAKLPQGNAALLSDPTWSPDGELIVSTGYSEDSNWSLALFVQPADGSQPPRVLLQDGGELWPHSFVPGSRELIYSDWKPERANYMLRLFDVDGGSEPRTLVALDGVDSRFGSVSPHGRWLAYSSTRDDASEVMLRPYPELGSPIQVSAGGGTRPRWDPRQAGRLYYWGVAGGRQTLMVVDVDDEGSLSVVRPFVDPARIADQSFLRYFAVTGDGDILAITREPGSGIVTHLDLVVDWASQLADQVPTDRG